MPPNSARPAAWNTAPVDALGDVTFINAARIVIEPIRWLWPDWLTAGKALTAWYGLIHLGALAPGQVALVHSVAGGEGFARSPRPQTATASQSRAHVPGRRGHRDSERRTDSDLGCW